MRYSGIRPGLQDRLDLGKLDARRDWGHARDYVDGIWRIVQAEAPDDYVLATGSTHSVRHFAEAAFAAVDLEIDWRGEGAEEKGIQAGANRCLIEIDPRYYRPTEVDLLVGDASKARERLGWSHTTTLTQMIGEMVASDLETVQRERDRLDRHG